MVHSSQKYALLSVYNKEGIVPFAKTLHKLGFLLISTGGTAKILSDNKLPAVPIEHITGNPESFDGRMKSISFQVGSGILYDRSNTKHQKEAKQLRVPQIDIVVCNLYPFEKTVQQKNVTITEAVENIDVGGPTMIRAAAKNHKHVLVVIDPSDYPAIEKLLTENQLTQATKKDFAAKAFAHVSLYDSQIARYLQRENLPQELTLPGRKKMDLRYGENPHQQAALYLTPNTFSVFNALQKLWGRDLSLTNVTDINAGVETVKLFQTPTAVVIKHNSPCGIALGKKPAQALARAIQSDPESAFGGVIVLNKQIDVDCAHIIASFKDDRRGNIDIIASPSITKKALDFLKTVRKSTGIYTFGELKTQPASETSGKAYNIKCVDGGFVLQTPDIDIEKSFNGWAVVTKKKPTPKQIRQMHIAWKFISRIRSNAIIVVDKALPMTRGIGSGQTSRVRSTQIALQQAGKYTQDAILASDSFFPFDDSVKLAAEYGISAIVQQGGSINDKLSIEAANALGLAMVFTNRRAFWH